MHIEKIHIKGFYSHNNTEIKLDKTTNIIVGTNGSGKSLFFECVEGVFENLLNKNTDLENNCSSKQDSLIEITIKFSEDEINVFNAIMFMLIIKRINYCNTKYYVDICKKINEYKLLNEGLVINYSYSHKNNCFETRILFKKNNCNCDCKNKHHDYDYDNPKCYYVELLNYKPEELKENNKKYYHETKDDIINHITNEIELKSEILKKISNIICKSTEENLSDIYINIRDNNCDLLDFLKKYICKSIIQIKNKKNMSVINILQNLINYEEYSDTKNYTYDNIIKNKKLYEFISFIDENYSKKEKLYKISNTIIFKKIYDKFYEITNKKFIINCLINENKIIDYEYFIDPNNNQKHKCSLGEYELINFLFDYYNNDSDIIFIDEPCTHLSTQNKIKLKNIFNDKDNSKQLIFITHDIEMINENNKIFYFTKTNENIDKKTNEITRVFDLGEINLNEKSPKNIKITNKINEELIIKNQQNEKIKFKDEKHYYHENKVYNKEKYQLDKNIYVNLPLLFATNVLIVEGYEDYIFIKCFLEVNKIYNYYVCINGSKTNQTIITICKRLKIKYKIIYDYDVLYDDNSNNYNNNTVEKKFKDLLSDIMKINIDFANKNYNAIIQELQKENVFIWNENIVEIEGIKFQLFKNDKIFIEEFQKKLNKSKEIKNNTKDFKITNEDLKDIKIINENIIEIRGIKYQLTEVNEKINENHNNIKIEKIEEYKKYLELENKSINEIKCIKKINKLLPDIFKIKSHEDIKEAIKNNMNNTTDLKDLKNFLE